MKISLSKSSPEFVCGIESLRKHIHQRNMDGVSPAFPGDYFDEELFYYILNIAYAAGATKVKNEVMGGMFELDTSPEKGLVEILDPCSITG